MTTRLDLGAGKGRHGEGWTTVDIRADFGADVTCDLGKERWPWEDNSVEEAWASHFVEHLTAEQRIHFANELHRVLLPGRSATIITPHWNSNRAYGDLTHQWPPVAEFWYFYLNADWRAVNAPHCDFYTCNFAPTMGYSPHPALAVKSNEYRQWATENCKEACQDLIATITKC
jgi:hypothetical protein